MIKNTELRIGNYVYLRGHRPAIQIKLLSKDDIFIDAAPIPITYNRLPRFGFRFNKLEFNDNILWWINNRMYLCNSGNIDKNTAILTNVRFVHQLQNLYFDLTGEELQLTNSHASFR